LRPNFSRGWWRPFTDLAKLISLHATGKNAQSVNAALAIKNRAIGIGSA
jgi:hypothetical protein